MLKQYNIIVDTAIEPRDSIDLVSNVTYDCLFISCDMTDMSSDEVIDKLNSTGNRVPSIIGVRKNYNSNVNVDNYNCIIDAPLELKKLDKVFNSLFGGDR